MYKVQSSNALTRVQKLPTDFHRLSQMKAAKLLVQMR
jgi:hypothetical protein